MHDRNDYDRCFLDTVVNAEWKALGQCAMCPTANRRIQGRLLRYRVKSAHDLVEELLAEPSLLLFVPSCSVLDIRLGLATKPNRKSHKRFLMSASTSSAARPLLPSAS